MNKKIKVYMKVKINNKQIITNKLKKPAFNLNINFKQLNLNL